MTRFSHTASFHATNHKYCSIHSDNTKHTTCRDLLLRVSVVDRLMARVVFVLYNQPLNLVDGLCVLGWSGPGQTGDSNSTVLRKKQVGLQLQLQLSNKTAVIISCLLGTCLSYAVLNFRRIHNNKRRDQSAYFTTWLHYRYNQYGR